MHCSLAWDFLAPRLLLGADPEALPRPLFWRRSLARERFVLLKKRWVVERTFGWLVGCRRLVRDYERLSETSRTFIYLAMIHIMVRRLA